MLKFTHTGKIDCIFIDPPYNTGAKDWKYNDNYVDSNDQYRHSKWLNFMERRLILSKNLLNQENSCLIITIDENERANLEKLLEQTFPESKIQMVSSTVLMMKHGSDGHLAQVNEYVFYVFIGKSQSYKDTYNLLETMPFDRKNDNNELEKVKYQNLRHATFGRNETQFYPIFVDSNTLEVVNIGSPVSMDFDYKSMTAPEGQDILWPISTTGFEGKWTYSSESMKK